MQRKIYLVRHAQTFPGNIHTPDEKRMLTPEGEASATRLGIYLKQKNSNLNLIITSHATRAYSTALAIQKALNKNIQIQVEKTLYAENTFEILRLLTALPDSVHEVMVVGHYPTVVELHNHLAGNKQLTILNTGELAVLTFTSSWGALSGGMANHEYTYHPPYLVT